MMRMTVTMAIAATLLLGACGDVGDPGTVPGPDTPTATGDPDRPQPGPTPSPTILEPREGLVDVEPHPWEEAVPLDEDRLLVTFFGGVEACYGVDRVEVSYEPETVTVTLYTGRLPEAEVCIEVAEFQGVEVDLDEPLAGRRVVDGSRE